MVEVKQHKLRVGDTNLCVFEWGRPGGHQVVLAHATGFHARCWDQVVAKLPDDWQVFAIEARGHGRSQNKAPYNWGRFATDLAELMTQLGISDATGVGHSMGGHCVAHVGALHPQFFSRLVLIDPVIFPPDQDAANNHGVTKPEDHPVARRRSHFQNWQEMFERYKDRQPYSLWEPKVFEDYCRYGVIPSGTGKGVNLCCPGVVEAQVYMENSTTNIYPLLPSITQPVTLLRACPRDPDSIELDFSASPTHPQLVDEFINGEEIYLPHLTHFIPMQDSQLVARVISQA